MQHLIEAGYIIWFPLEWELDTSIFAAHSMINQYSMEHLLLSSMKQDFILLQSFQKNPQPARNMP